MEKQDATTPENKDAKIFVPPEAIEGERKMPNYKGETIEISSIKGNALFAAEVLEPELPAIKTKFRNVKARKMPRLIILTSVDPAPADKKNRQIKYFSYLNKFKQGMQEVVGDFKIKRLTGKQSSKMMDAYNQMKIDTLPANLEHNFHIGSNLEIFVEDKEGNVIPAFTLFDAKSAKKKVGKDGMPEGAIYWNGYQAGFETSVGGCLSYHIDTIHDGLKKLLDAARLKDKNYTLSHKSVSEISYEKLQEYDEKYVVLNNTSATNAYNLSTKVIPPRELSLRFASGSLYFNCGKLSKDEERGVVNALDAILAVCCVSLFDGIDSKTYREFYAQPGTYNASTKGLEYLGLSNAFLCHPLITDMVFRLARKVFMFGKNGYMNFWKASKEETLDVITKCDAQKAREIMERNKVVLLKILSAAYEDHEIERAYKVFFEGVASAIKEPKSVSNNWQLEGVWNNHADNTGVVWNKAYKKLAKGEKV